MTTVSQQALAQQPAKPNISPVPGGLLQRQCACGQHTSKGGECEECKQKREGALQRAAINPSPVHDVPPIVHEVLRSSGQPLDMTTRSFMEPRFRHDFSGVRVHTDLRAAESARAVNALAYSVGQDVVFGAGQYELQSGAGQRLMAHELTHVIQQQGAATRLSTKRLRIGSVNDAAEYEADAMANRLMYQADTAVTGIKPIGLQVSRKDDPFGERPASSGASKRRPGSTLPYREATELAECMRIMGEANRDYCRETVLGEKPQPPIVTISRQGGNAQSFISTDTITLTATVASASGGPAPAVPINWTVTGVSANAGNGNPHTAKNRAQFAFKPNPSSRPKTGSRSPNDPIEYRVAAEAGGGTDSFSLVQDETDIIRQEYIDLGPATPPARSSIVTPTIATVNTGNYSLIVDGGMDNALTNTEAEFQALTPQGQVAPAISVSSGYRNPRRNVAAGSQFPVTSRHVRGTALDLTVPGANATLWARLRLAGSNAGNSSICEDGPTQVPCGAANVDHVHIQW